MHLRWSSIIGMPVTDDHAQEIVAFLREPLIDPDTGRILGFHVSAMTGFLFLSAIDILSIGTSVHIRSSQKLSPPDELIRLQEKFEDERTFIGQRICIRENGRRLGRCADIQFESHHFSIEWLFPKVFFFYRQPIPSSDILEVTADAIWVKSPLRPEKEQPALLVPDVVPSMRA